MKSNKKGFTLSEALIIMVLMGVVAILYSAGIKAYNPTQKGFDVKSKKTLENLDQAITLIIANHSPMFTLEYVNDSQGSFTITDEGVSGRLAALFKDKLVIVDNNFAEKHQDYYSSPLLNYNKTPVGSNLNSIYSDFMMSENGVIYGFRLYKSCNADEANANPPLKKERYTVRKICGSIFYDVNAYQKPNKLGSDQYIVPFDVNGIEIKRQ